jgi:hypothetical protein
VPTKADGELAAVVDVMSQDMKNDLLSRAWAEHLALSFAQAGWRLEDMSEVGDGPAGERALDHGPGGLKSGHQLGG